MPRGRAIVRVALYCTQAGCSEQALAEAQRSNEGGGRFELVPPPGWSGVREQLVEFGAPYEVPALCPTHGPNVSFFLRSLEDVIACLRDRRDARARAARTRVARCVQAIETWKSIAPTGEQLAAMVSLVADLRADMGLPPAPATGVRKATREPKP